MTNCNMHTFDPITARALVACVDRENLTSYTRAERARVSSELRSLGMIEQGAWRATYQGKMMVHTGLREAAQARIRGK